MGLLLLGVLGVLQTPAPTEAALQPSFEESKVREGSCQAQRQGGARGQRGALPGQRGAEKKGWTGRRRLTGRGLPRRLTDRE